jgi:capsular polysaccharide biosynthesis protein
MKIQDYLHVIRKRWWLIALVMLSAAGSAYVISKSQTRMYRSQAVVGVLFNRLDTGGNFFADKLLNSYVNLVYQPDKLQAISNQLGLDRSGTALMREVRLQPQPDQMRIVIEADAIDPAMSRNIANAVAHMLNARVVEVNRTLQGEDRAFLDLSQTAAIGVLAKPQTRINVLAGLLLGVVLGTLLAFVLEFLDDTLKTAADVERFAGLSTIGAIPSGGAQQSPRPRLRPAAATGLVASSGPGDHPRS